jgi:hypothetical protein
VPPLALRQVRRHSARGAREPTRGAPRYREGGAPDAYVCRLLRLTLLAPDIVERILDGRPTAGLAQFLKPFPVEWERQRTQFCAALMKPDEAGVLG